MNLTEFDELIARVQTADESAAALIAESFETEIRRYIRFRLKTSRMKRLIESVDICQSVFAKFFVDLQHEAVCPQSPDQLKALLITMAKNKLVDKARHYQGGKRDIRRVDADGEWAMEHARDSDKTPDSMLADQEILDRFRALLSDSDRDLVDARMQGASWVELASRTGASAEALRKRVSRAIEAAAAKLGTIA